LGRPAIPTSLKVLRGNPGKGPINTSEPKPPPADATAPSCLTDHGLAVWNQTVPVLCRMGVFTQIDRMTLTRYCLLSEQFEAVVKHVREHGMTQLTQTGYSQLTAEGALFKSLPAELLRIEQQFGMTPASRSAIKVTDAGTAEDPLEAYIQSRGA
jgi:P27 family predicted phage terminase small subunit